MNAGETITMIMSVAHKARTDNLPPIERESFEKDFAKLFFSIDRDDQRRIAQIVSGAVLAPKPSEIVKVKNLCKYFGRDKSTIIRWIKNGKLQSITLPNGHKAVMGSTIIDMIQSGKIKKGN